VEKYPILCSILRYTVILTAKAVPLHARKAHGGEEVSSYSFLTSALDGGEWSAEAVLGIGNIGFCLGPRAFRGLTSIV
jgi:hypothetical protein